MTRLRHTLRADVFCQSARSNPPHLKGLAYVSVPGYVSIFLVVVVFMAGLTGCPSSVEVPGVVGLTQAAAEATIDDSVFFVGEITFDFSDSVAEGIVISQSPAGGEFADPLSSIDLVVSLSKVVNRG
jgi:beta-lactam-binding protein with PASTA domain